VIDHFQFKVEFPRNYSKVALYYDRETPMDFYLKALKVVKPHPILVFSDVPIPPFLAQYEQYHFKHAVLRFLHFKDCIQGKICTRRSLPMLGNFLSPYTQLILTP
jgi:hypothetical protein